MSLSKQKRNQDESQKKIKDGNFYHKSNVKNGYCTVTIKMDGSQVICSCDNQGKMKFFTHNGYEINSKKNRSHNGIDTETYIKFQKIVERVLPLIKEQHPTFKYAKIFSESMEACSNNTFNRITGIKVPVPEDEVGKLFVFEIKIELEDGTSIHYRPYQDDGEFTKYLFEHFDTPKCIFKGELNPESFKTICNYLKENYLILEGVVIYFVEDNKGYKLRTGHTESHPSTKKMIQELSENPDITSFQKDLVDMYYSTKPKVERKSKEKNKKEENQIKEQILIWLDQAIYKVGGHMNITSHFNNAIKTKQDEEKFKTIFIEELIKQYKKDDKKTTNIGVSELENIIKTQKLRNLDAFFRHYFPTNEQQVEKLESNQKYLNKELLKIKERLHRCKNRINKLESQNQ